MSGGTIAEPPDARPVFSVSLAATVLVAGAPVTVTFTARRADGGVRPFSGTLGWLFPDGQRHRLAFVDGVASLAWRPRASGSGIFNSTPDRRLLAPVRFEVWDS